MLKMRKSLAFLVAASIVWASGPGPVLAAGRAVSVPSAVSSPVLGGAPLVGLIGAPGAKASSNLAVPTLGESQLFVPSIVLPSHKVAVVEKATKIQPGVNAEAVGKTVAPTLSFAPIQGRASLKRPSLKDPHTRPQQSPRGKQETVQSRLSQLNETLLAHPKSANAADSKADLDKAFSGSSKADATAPVRVEEKTFSAHGRGRLTAPTPESVNHAQSPLAVEPAVEAVVANAQGKNKKSSKKEGKTKLPRSFHYYLGGQLLYGIGQESAALIAPLYAYAAMGLEFTVLSQAAALLAIIPGSLLGSRLVRKFDSKKVYIVGNLVHAAFFISVPIMHYLTGSFSPIHFLAFKIVGGLIYGSLRGVAEKEIVPRIIGQNNKKQLKKAGSLFYAAFESAEFISALSIGFMIAGFGLNWTTGIMAAIMLSSVIPLWFMKFKQKGPVTDTGETGGTEKKLPWKLYVPFVFAIFVHMSMYDFITPFLALEVFHMEALASRLIAAYTLGSLAVALFTSYMPQLAGKISERKWTGIGIAATIAFLWGSLLLQMPWVSLALAGVLGAALTGMMIQWRAVYQQRLALSVQPKVFERLMIASVLMTLVPFAVMQGGLLIGGSSMMVTLLTIVSAGITAGALGYPLLSSLWTRFKKNRS